jgi:hypothetical protein
MNHLQPEFLDGAETKYDSFSTHTDTLARG